MELLIYTLVLVLAELLLIKYCKQFNLVYTKIGLDCMLLSAFLIKYGITIYFLKCSILLVFLTALSLIDLYYKRLPDSLTAMLFILASLNSLLTGSSMLSLFANISVYSSVFLILNLIGRLSKKQLMGLGDVKLSTAIGAFMCNTVFVYYLFMLLTFVSAGLFGLFFILKHTDKTIALAPFMLFAISIILYFNII